MDPAAGSKKPCSVNMMTDFPLLTGFIFKQICQDRSMANIFSPSPADPGMQAFFYIHLPQLSEICGLIIYFVEDFPWKKLY